MLLHYMTKHNGPLEAVDCHIHSVRYDMVLEYRWQPSQIGPHQVTYDVVAIPLRPTNKYLSRAKDASILSWPTIMGH